MGRVDDLWLKADDLKFDTESDISDVSEIWSEYGDKVCPSSQPKMVRWNQGRKKKVCILCHHTLQGGPTGFYTGNLSIPYDV